jgi:NitT/TauT family transport system permease protein
MYPPLNRRQDLGLGALGLFALLLLWCIVTYGGFVRPLFLPTPGGIWEGLVEYYHRGWLLTAVWKSLVRILLSVLLITLIGVPLGILMGSVPAVDAALRNIVNGAKAVPTTGLIALVVLWFSIEEKAKIVFLFLGGIFYMIVMAREAVLAVPDSYIRVARDIGASRWQILTRVIFPSALPGIWAAIAVTNALCWTYLLVAEFINSSEEQLGLGYLLYMGSRTQDAGKVFGVLVLIALISSMTDWGLRAAKARWADW